MSFEVDTALVNTFHSNIDLGLQQKGSKLRPFVREESQNSEFDFWDRIGVVDAVEVEDRHSDTPLISTPHDRRRNQTKDFDWADLIDRKDRIRMLGEPTGPYTLNAIYALGRKMDKQVIDAGFGTAYTGKAGGTTKSFASANEIAANFVEGGAAASLSNLTIGKLRRTRLLLDLEDAADDDEMPVLVGTVYQRDALLRSTEVTSSDYNTVKALVNGEIDNFLGIRFVWVVPSLLPKSGDVRDCLVFTRQSIMLGVADDIMVDVGPRRDKRNSVQVYACGSFGATRMWEEKCVKIKCDETK